MSRDQQGQINALSRTLQDAFHLKGLRKLADMGLDGDKRLEALELIEKYRNARKQEQEDFKEGYEARVSIALKELQQEAGGKSLTLQPRFAYLDHFDKNQLMMRAQKRVHQHHENKMNTLDQQETQALENLAARTGYEFQSTADLVDHCYGAAHEEFSQNFNQATTQGFTRHRER